MTRFVRVPWAGIFLLFTLALIACSSGPSEAEQRGYAGIEFQQASQAAIAHYDEAIRLDPKDVEAYHGRGMAYYTLGQYQRAIEDSEEAIRLDPQHAGAYYNRGNNYFKLGQHQRAIQDYDEAIRLNPYFSQAYWSRALAYTILGKDMEAQRDVDRVVELGDDREELEAAIEERKKQRYAETIHDCTITTKPRWVSLDAPVYINVP